jgi:hypothetical protein
MMRITQHSLREIAKIRAVDEPEWCQAKRYFSAMAIRSRAATTFSRLLNELMRTGP